MGLSPIIQRYKVRAPDQVTLPVEPPATGYRTVDGEWRDYTIEVEIDIDRIVRDLGDRAIRNVGGRCSAADGRIKIKRIGKRGW